MRKMRLDKFLTECGLGTRSEVKAVLKKKRVTVNGLTETAGKRQVDGYSDEVCLDGLLLERRGMAYYMLNKPKGVITATEDAAQRTVLDLIDGHDRVRGLFPVGRLDKDTTGLLLLTDDGALAHELLAPKKHVAKTYAAEIEGIVTEREVRTFAGPMKLRNGEVTKPAVLKVLSVDEKKGTSSVLVTISEGKYHQVRRMFASVAMHVLELDRRTMGPLTLDSALAPGKYRALTRAEVEALKCATRR